MYLMDLGNSQSVEQMLLAALKQMSSLHSQLLEAKGSSNSTIDDTKSFPATSWEQPVNGM